MTRKKKNLPVKKKKVIYCEGDSEEAYFKMLKRKYHGGKLIKIKCIGEGADGCVRFAINDTENGVSKKYVVCDVDDHTNQDIDSLLRMGKKHKINILFSNVCFEVWVLSHYELLSSDVNLERGELYRRLENHMNIENYIKFKGNKYDDYLYDKVQIAARNIDLLRTKIVGDNPQYNNPYTSISGNRLKEIFDTQNL